MLYRGGRIATGSVSAGVGIPTPNHRPTRPFARVGAAAGLLLSQFPLRPITNAALEGKGSFETLGFKRRFLHTFCRC